MFDGCDFGVGSADDLRRGPIPETARGARIRPEKDGENAWRFGAAP